MSLRLVKSGKQYFEVLADIIEKAQKQIHLQTYIFAEDETGTFIAQKLQQKAQEGVKVYVLIDAFGSKGLSKSFKNDLVKSGIALREFSPVQLFRLYVGRRLHQKVVVVDENFALVGGINIANKYAGYNSTPWLDYAVLIEEQNLVKDCLRICLELWNKTYTLLPSKKLFQSISETAQHDFFRRKDEISRSYKRAVKTACHEIIIVASYFLPSKGFLALLKKASQKGVKVKIIVSKESDVIIFKKATEYLYKELYKNRIELYEYLPSVVHAKVILIDKAWCSVGSFNLNALSEYGSIELNINTANSHFVSEIYQDLQYIMQNYCLQLTEKDIQKKTNWWAKLNYALVRLLIRAFFWLVKKLKSYKKQYE